MFSYLLSDDERGLFDQLQRERIEGEFRRVLNLPEDVDPERVEASCREGVLPLRTTSPPR